MLDRRITIVSNNQETLDGVQLYLRRVGARAHGASRLDETDDTCAEADAILLFADDYPQTAAFRAFAHMRAAHPRTLVVVVTEDVGAFARSWGEDDGGRVVVLRRPAWGWMLVDAIRSAAPASD